MALAPRRGCLVIALLAASNPPPSAKAERLKEMLKQKYSRQKAETDEMASRRKKLEDRMAQVRIALFLFCFFCLCARARLEDPPSVQDGKVRPVGRSVSYWAACSARAARRRIKSSLCQGLIAPRAHPSPSAALSSDGARRGSTGRVHRSQGLSPLEPFRPAALS